MNERSNKAVNDGANSGRIMSSQWLQVRNNHADIVQSYIIDFIFIYILVHPSNKYKRARACKISLIPALHDAVLYLCCCSHTQVHGHWTKSLLLLWLAVGLHFIVWCLRRCHLHSTVEHCAPCYTLWVILIALNCLRIFWDENRWRFLLPSGLGNRCFSFGRTWVSDERTNVYTAGHRKQK